MSNMKITYLGTAAAEGMPAVWCNCEACKKAKELGEKNIRTRSQVLVNSDLLVDFPMDTFMHAITNKLDLSAIETVLITHAHMDHCYPQEFTLHGKPYAHNMTAANINIYGNDTVIDTIINHNSKQIHADINKSVILNTLKPYDKFVSGKYTVTALPAVHTVGENCLIYIISDGKVNALMFNDSGILDSAVYNRLNNMGIKLDFISFDCTYGYARHGAGRHMGLLDNVDERDKMQKAGILKQNTRFVATHFSHNGNLMHSEIQAKCAELGFDAAFDGFSFSL